MRRRLRFSLRTMTLAVLAVGCALGVWSQAGRWCVLALRHDLCSTAAWNCLQRLNGVDDWSASIDAAPIRINADRRGGHIWVHEPGLLRCVSAEGKFLGASMAFSESHSQIVWRGLLPDGRPGMAFWHRREEGPSSLQCMAADSGQLETRLIVLVNDSSAELTCAANNPRPVFVLRGKGEVQQCFPFPLGPVAKSADTTPLDRSLSWAAVLRR